jgi:hypothetical protein
MLQIIYFLIILCVLYISLISNDEHFDQRVDGATKEHCGIICTKTLGCSGFAYDDNNNFCYLSKDKIVINPEKKNYSNFYNKEFSRCNKLYMIDDPYYNSRNNIIRNATYECMPKENDIDNKENIIYDTKERKNIDINNINKENVSPYTFVNIEWENWQASEDKKIVPVNLDYNLHLITNPTENNSINIMKEYDDEFNGDYLFQHKCVRNISKQNCMKQCLDDKKCVGTEWNPILIKKIGEPNKYTFDENVCCPKRRINKVIPRRKDMRFGHFYLKENTMKNDLQQQNILVECKNEIKKENENKLDTSNYKKWNQNDF